MRFLLIASLPESILTFRGPLIKALMASGFDVCIAAPGLHASSPIRRELEDIGADAFDIPMKRTGMNPFSDWLSLWRLVQLMRRIRPDAMLAYTAKPVIYGSIAAWLTGVPRRFALVTGLGYAFTGEQSGLLSYLVGSMYRFSLAKVHKVFLQNADDQALLLGRGILGKRATIVLVNGSGVDIDEFAVQPVSTNPVNFLMIGRLLANKGVREFVNAASRVHALYPDVKFGLVGWIDENPDSVSQAELDAWVESGAVDYLGRLSDVRVAIENCSVYVLPSYREGTPRTVLEAMAMGRAVITTDAPGCRETVSDGENGFLVPIKSVSGLVDAMLRFIAEPDLIVRMGKRSREIAEEKYDVRKVNEVMLREMGIMKPA